MEVNELTEKIIGVAIKVHRVLGPGLLESVYEECMARELTKMKIPFQRQVDCHVEWEGEIVRQRAFRIDLLVDESVVVELKSVSLLAEVHVARALTYMRFREVPVGLMFNFNVPRLTDGIRRLILPGLPAHMDLKKT